MDNMKKDFQKAVKTFRDGSDYHGEYPKAMMTAQQMYKRTATINCGRAEFGEELAPKVLAHKDFVDWCVAYGIKTVKVEIAKEASYMKPQYQIRVTY
jgi:hypothetical protein